jgi:hypothetical protein
MTNLKHLHDYLSQVKKEAFKEHFEQINLRPEFLAFKDIFVRNRWINFTPMRVDDFFNEVYDKMSKSLEGNIDNVLRVLEEKMNSIKGLNKM